MENNLEVFNKVRSDLTLLAEKNKNLVINGINDIEGYIKAKEARKELRDAEIALEKLAKQERDGALNYQRGIIKLEKDLLTITSPIIEDLKRQVELVDKLKAREERRALLPDRMAQLAEISLDKDQEEVLDLDEKQWADFYSNAKLNYLEAEDKKRRDKEKADKDEADRIENERIREENAKLKADKDLVDAENKRLAEEKRLKDEADEKEAKRILDEEADRQAKLRGEKYDAFLLDCGITAETPIENFLINDTKLPDGTTRVTVYKKVNSIIL